MSKQTKSMYNNHPDIKIMPRLNNQTFQINASLVNKVYDLRRQALSKKGTCLNHFFFFLIKDANFLFEII